MFCKHHGGKEVDVCKHHGANEVDVVVVQIALFAVVNLPEKEIAHHKIAKATCDLTFQGQNLQAFLIGRQICVTVCAFFVARITTIAVDIGAEENIFGVQNWVQAFFNTGILGALITTIVGSLAFRIIASSFPVPFLSNPMIYVILRVCLFIEASGVCSAAWLLGLINKQVVGFQEDEVYIGKPSERAEAEKDVDFNDLTLAAGNEELEEK
jgi:Silicon transporter